MAIIEFPTRGFRAKRSRDFAAETRVEGGFIELQTRARQLGFIGGYLT